MSLPLTAVSGTIFDVNGSPAAGVAVYIARVEKSGIVIEAHQRLAGTSDELGEIEFTVARNSTAWISGSFRVGATSFASDTAVSIPDAATATLESLGSVAGVPSTGLTVKVNGVAGANPIGTLDIGSGITATESPTGEINLSVSASGGEWGDITGTLADQTDLQAALDAKAPLASPSFTTLASLTNNAVGATSTDGVVIQNATPAGAGAQQLSPRLRFTGQGWKTNTTAGSQTVDFIQQVVPVQGAIQVGFSLETRAQFNGGGYLRAALLGYAPATTANGQGNSFYGYTAGGVNNDDVTVAGGYNNTFIGGEAGKANTIGFQNTFIGSRAGASNISGNENTFVGQGAGFSVTSSNNVALGFHALLNNSSGANNVGIGSSAGESTAGASTSANSVYIGFQAGKNNLSASGNNVLIGHMAGTVLSTATNTVAIGYLAGTAITSGGGNTVIGREAGKALSTQANNVFVGQQAGIVATSASNTMVGAAVGISNTTGANNTFLGFQAGFTATGGNANVSGSNNTFLGYNSGPGSASQVSNSAAIGASAVVSASNTIQLGDTAVVLVNTSAQIKGASVRGTAVAFASLPATPVEGMLVPVTDSSTGTWGATITGGGANHVLAYYNGTNWVVS